MKILLTGSSGFIGFHTARALLDRGHEVAGADSMNAYYDPKLKHARLRLLRKLPGFSFRKLDLANRRKCAELFRVNQASDPRLQASGGEESESENGLATRDALRATGIAPPFDVVVHLAAQAGVRYSLTNPHAYVDSNLTAFVNVLEGCRHSGVKHLVYASSSSVYGGNTKLPFSEDDRVDSPVSLYAATKKADELMAHVYSHLFGLRCTGLRFFTVYGPFGRPDMAMFKFTKAMIAGEEIDVYNHGDMQRDFTYIDDIVEGVVRVAESVGNPESRNSNSNGIHNPGQELRTPHESGPRAESGESACREAASGESGTHTIYNIGNNRPEQLMDLIRMLEEELGRKARVRFLPMQPGDVPSTYADTAAIERDFGFKPGTPLREGVRRFVEWYRKYYGV